MQHEVHAAARSQVVTIQPIVRAVAFLIPTEAVRRTTGLTEGDLRTAGGRHPHVPHNNTVAHSLR
jgi:hypothetical protein